VVLALLVSQVLKVFKVSLEQLELPVLMVSLVFQDYPVLQGYPVFLVVLDIKEMQALM